MTKQQRILKLLKSPPGRPIWSDGYRFATHQEAGGRFGKRSMYVVKVINPATTGTMVIQ